MYNYVEMASGIALLIINLPWTQALDIIIIIAIQKSESTSVNFTLSFSANVLDTSLKQFVLAGVKLYKPIL